MTSPYSRGALSRVWPVKLLSPPSLPTFPLPLSLSPRSPTSLTFNQMILLPSNAVSSSTVTATFSWLAPKHQAFRTHSQAAWCLGTNIRAYRTALHAGLNYKGKVYQWQIEGLYRRRPTPLETQEKKRQREKHTHHWLQFTRAQLQTVDPRQNQPIKLELELLTHTYTAKYLRVHLWVLGVYKGSRVA